MSYYLGLDLGGTNVKVGILDDTGKTLVKDSMPTKAHEGFDNVVAVMDVLSRQAIEKAGLRIEHIDGIGIGAPGPLDMAQGIILAAPNFRGWHNVPMRDRVAQALGRPAVLENDANAAAFGEYWIGAGRDPAIRDMVMLTLGTGVGAGLVADGHVLHGGFGMAGEAGHMIVQLNGRLCACGQRGCLEAYASATNTAARAMDALKNGQESSLRQLLQKPGSTISAKDVFDAARNGDLLAQAIAEETATYLGVACVTLCRLLDPQMIVFAGGMILAGAYLFDRVRTAYQVHHWNLLPSRTQIVPAQLGNDAGFIGAAAVARDAHHQGKLTPPRGHGV